MKRQRSMVDEDHAIDSVVVRHDCDPLALGWPDPPADCRELTVRWTCATCQARWEIHVHRGGSRDAMRTTELPTSWEVDRARELRDLFRALSPQDAR